MINQLFKKSIKSNLKSSSNKTVVFALSSFLFFASNRNSVLAEKIFTNNRQVSEVLVKVNRHFIGNFKGKQKENHKEKFKGILAVNEQLIKDILKFCKELNVSDQDTKDLELFLEDNSSGVDIIVPGPVLDGAIESLAKKVQSTFTNVRSFGYDDEDGWWYLSFWREV